MVSITIQLDEALWEKVQRHAEALGTSPQHYLTALVESHEGNRTEDALITRQLEKLGYIDAGLDI